MPEAGAASSDPVAAPPRVLLVSTYDLGRQPFGLASPAAFLRAAGIDVRCLDLSVEPLDEAVVRSAGLVAFHLPMHTATRIALRAAARVRAMNPAARLCFYGLYAPPNEARLRRAGAEAILGGEFEDDLVRLALRAAAGPPPQAAVVSLDRLEFKVPWRDGLPPLDRYARLRLPSGEERLAGYTEASRGCRHLCRHCPVVPVYAGRFRVVGAEIVLEDIRRQVAAGARHVTFGDPDFLNGPAHAMAIVEALHAEHPSLTFDVTVKIEHLLRHERLLPRLREAGCLFVTSAVESVEDRVLERLDKGHTRSDALRAIALARRAGLALHPTFVPFTPWTTLPGYRDLLGIVDSLGLVEAVAPLQLALRLLIPAGSRLLELEDVRSRLEPFDADRLAHPWRHEDPAVDALQARIEAALRSPSAEAASRNDLFGTIRRIAAETPDGKPAPRLPAAPPTIARAAVPYMTEPWFC